MPTKANVVGRCGLNTFTDKIVVSGFGKSLMQAVFAAFLQLNTELASANTSLVNEALKLKCPEECSEKKIDGPRWDLVAIQGRYDKKKRRYGCRLTLSGSIAVLCRAPDS